MRMHLRFMSIFRGLTGLRMRIDCICKYKSVFIYRADHGHIAKSFTPWWDTHTYFLDKGIARIGPF